MRDKAERIVVNTGPLIALARMNALHVAGALPLSFACPRQVREELDAGFATGYPHVDPPWLEVLELTTPPSPLAVAALDLGEAAVIHLALELGVERVCIDESKGRRLASGVGLTVTGSLGLLLRAKLQGAVPHLRPIIQRGLDAGVWYDGELVRKVLAAADER